MQKKTLIITAVAVVCVIAGVIVFNMSKSSATTEIETEATETVVVAEKVKAVESESETASETETTEAVESESETAVETEEVEETKAEPVKEKPVEKKKTSSKKAEPVVETSTPEAVVEVAEPSAPAAEASKSETEAKPQSQTAGGKTVVPSGRGEHSMAGITPQAGATQEEIDRVVAETGSWRAE